MNESIINELAKLGAKQAERYANEIKVALLPSEWKEIGITLSSIPYKSDIVKELLFFIEQM